MGKHFIKEVGSQVDREEKVLMRLFGGFEDAIEDLNRADAVDSRAYMMLDQFFLQLSTEILNVCNTSRGKRLCISNHLSYGSIPSYAGIHVSENGIIHYTLLVYVNYI